MQRSTSRVGWSTWLMVLLVSPLVTNALQAQAQSVRRALLEDVPMMTAIRAVTGSPRLDGSLDDAAWRAATPITDFTQVRPNDGTEPTERTEVWVTYDSDALYIAARLYDREPGGIESRLGRRDSRLSSDAFTVAVDSYHDHRTSFQFGVNPAGVRTDQVTTNDNGRGDASWDPVWAVATSIDSSGWTVEMRIPFSQLRFSATDEWGINFSRSIFRKNEFIRWSWAPNTEQGYASLFGHLQGLDNIPAPRRVEVLPYTLAQTDRTEGADPTNPFNDGSIQNVTGGLDIKYGVTSNLTLDATVNPDFGQVEADPAVVNLTAFETFFQERRPFFVEGANLFRFGAGSGGFVFGAPQLFYSRRVGRAPSRRVFEPGGFADNPTATRILGAGKLSGQSGSWSLGLLQAVTASEVARVQRGDGSRGTEPVEPLAAYTVLSLRRDFRDGGTGVGAMATGVNRRLNDPVFTSLRTAAYAGGMDFFHRFGGNQFTVTGTLSGSRIAGDPAAITRAQTSSARYYQRPDQNYVSLDPNATSMTGFAGSMQLGKVAGNWTYGTDLFAYSPGYEINDAGFQTQTDRIFSGFRLSRRWLDPGPVFRNFSIQTTFAQNWNFGGNRLGRNVFFGTGGQLLNYWTVFLNGSYNSRRLDDKATRGGPLMEAPPSWSGNVFFGSDGRKSVSVNGYGYYARNTEEGFGRGFGGTIEMRPTAAATVSISPNYDNSHSIGFYVTSRPDASAAATFGSRYVFSELIQTSLNLTVRADVAVSPNLTFQLYAQPFIASGDYLGFKELQAPRTFDFVEYGVENGSTIALDNATNNYAVDPDGGGPAATFAFANPDFRFRSLRGNLVVRWEYNPGSTLFLVWNHGRSGFSTDPTFRGLRGFGDLFDDDQRNTFLVKLNYWLSR